MKNKIHKTVLAVALFGASLIQPAYAEDNDYEDAGHDSVQEELAELMASEEGHELEQFVKTKLSQTIWNELQRKVKDAPEEAIEGVELLWEIHEEHLEFSENEPQFAEQFLLLMTKEIETQIQGEAIERAIDAGASRESLQMQMNQLRKDLNDIFEIKHNMQKRELAALEDEVSEIKAMLQTRQKNREAIVDKRLNDLIGTNDELEW